MKFNDIKIGELYDLERIDDKNVIKYILTVMIKDKYSYPNSVEFKILDVNDTTNNGFIKNSKGSNCIFKMSEISNYQVKYIGDKTTNPEYFL